MTQNIQRPNDPVIDDAELYRAFRLMKDRDYDGAETLLDQCLEGARAQKDVSREGIYLSTKGVLYKLKKDYKKSYKFYQQAEKLLKDDPSIKIVTSILLIEEFHQYDTAVRKLQKTIEATQDPSILHHAQTIQARGYFLMGKKDVARTNLETILKRGFDDLRSAADVDFKMVALFVEKKFELEKCLDYLQKALALAQARQEPIFESVILQLITGVQRTTL